MLKLSKEQYLDKLYACWIGKNIGGTLGTPYEGTCDFLDIKGFASPSGEPLPNDDLDLQLVWLFAMEEVGARSFSANVLAEYWMNCIPPHWNEYGVCKTNLSIGLLPPMSGEVDNDLWKTSNGAWIRSEIWAGLAPGAPDIALKYATMDAMVDHGVSEGSYAEIFTAAMQSHAYIESDIRTLITSALTKIPYDCLIAKTARLVMECYDNGVPYRETREKVIELNKEMGWFQAPANIGFVIIGLLYGEGDFKKSLICAVNCGDDTDCTGATVGATLGIIGGTAAIPTDWREYVGDRIIFVAINGCYKSRIPKTCEELTRRVAALVPEVMRANRVNFEFADETDYPAEETAEFNQLTADILLDRSPFSFDLIEYHTYSVRVELDKTPRVKPGDERKVTLTFKCDPRCRTSKKLILKLYLPETWEATDFERTIPLEYPQPRFVPGFTKTTFTVRAGEKLEAVNRVLVEVTSPSIPYTVVVPIVFIA